MSGLAAFPARRSPVLRSFLGLLCGLTLVLAAPAMAAAATPGPADLVDWTSADGVANVATGSAHGVSVTLTGSDVQAGGVTDGTFGGFAAAFFTPAAPATDAIALASFPGYSYTLTFSTPVTDPVLDLASLGSTIAFEAGTSLVRLNGQPGFVVSGATVIGAVGDLGSPNNDVNGSVQVIGTFTSLSFTATPVPAAPNGDGLYLQVALPFPPVNVVVPSVRPVAGGVPPAIRVCGATSRRRPRSPIAGSPSGRPRPSAPWSAPARTSRHRPPCSASRSPVRRSSPRPMAPWSPPAPACTSARRV